MWANNETGNVYPVEKCAEIAHRYGALFHTDAVQSIGKIPCNMAESEIDMLSLSGHKLHAPKGVGALYLCGGGYVTVRDIIGGHQERGRRAGTENVASIIGLGQSGGIGSARYERRKYQNQNPCAINWKTGICDNIPKAKVLGDPGQAVCRIPL